MSKRKITLVIVSMIIAIVFMLIPNKVNAATTLTTPVYFGIQEFRGGTTPENMAYAINNPYDNGSTVDSIVGTKIWQIVKYNSKTDVNFNTGNFYCVRAGVGFVNTGDIAEYNISYDFKTEKDAIVASGNTVLQSIVNNGYYNNLLALADLLYLDGVSTDAERTALLESAEIHEEDYTAHLTDSDIQAVQQAAIWYYSNHDDEVFEKVYNNLGKTSWLYYNTLERSQSGEKYTSLSDYNMTVNDDGEQVGDGKQRQEQAVLLYNYLINRADKYASLYEDGTAESRTKITLYANATEQNTQPIILIERLPEEAKEFDLALRKYITKVDGVSLTGADSRVPNIDESTLTSETTAIYKHKKDPITVQTGSVVTYNLTVYNEGEKAGRATKIVDQLPTGLQFSKINTNGFSASYDEANNKVTITRDEDNTTNLEAYSENGLKSETIEIECIVTAKSNSTSDTILTNVAWISEEYDAVDNVIITNQEDKDRDSEPNTTPSVNKDNMSGYTGNNNKADLTDSTYYYKGQQDDDDFEKVKLLKINPGQYNVVLVKEDADGEQLNSKAVFEVNGKTENVTGKLTIANDVAITTENVATPDVYTIKETVAPDEYCKFDGTITITVTKKIEDNTCKIDGIEYKVTDDEGNDITESSKEALNVYLNENGNIYVEVKN